MLPLFPPNQHHSFIFSFAFSIFFGYLFFLFLTTTGNFQYFLFIKLKWCSNQKEKEKLTDWKIKHSGSFCYSFFVTTYFVYLVLYKVCYGKIFSFSHFFLLVVVNRKEKLHFTWTRHTLMAIMAILIKPWSVCVICSREINKEFSFLFFITWNIMIKYFLQQQKLKVHFCSLQPIRVFFFSFYRFSDIQVVVVS